jgi:hypothetical protein
MSKRTLAVDMAAFGGRWISQPETVEREGWTLAQTYPDEDPVGTFLVDLSHLPKALVVGAAADKLTHLEPGRAGWEGRRLICCRKPGERIVLDLAGSSVPAWPDPGYTDLTDAWVLLAVIGPETGAIMQRLIAIDFDRPDLNGPVYLITRAHGLWVQVVNLKTAPPACLIACDRSLGQHLAGAVIHAGHHLDLRPSGLEAFDRWLGKMG